MFFGNNEIVDIQFLHHVIEFVLIYRLAPHSIDAKGLFELIKLVPKDEMSALIEMGTSLPICAIELKRTEMHIVLGHQLDKLVDFETILVAACEPKDELCLILSDVVAIFSYNILHSLHANLALFGKSMKIVLQASSFAIIFDKGPLEFFELEHVNIFAFELSGQVGYLLV